MIKIGNFLFHYRNGLFPVLYLLLFLQWRPLLPDFRQAALIGLVIALIGQAFRVVTIGFDYIIRGGRDRRVYAKDLVTGGMFSHCRNPLYVGNFLIIVGLGIASNSLFFVAVMIPLFAFIYRAIVAAEENFLLGKFGAAFQSYCADVNRFLPNFSGFSKSISGMTYNWRRVITAEYGSAYIWTAGMLAVTLRNALTTPGTPHRDILVRSLWIGLGIVTLAYLAARILKKTGRLVAPMTSMPKSEPEPQAN